MFHAQDDPYIPWRLVKKFADSAGIRLRLFPRGGHLRTERVVRAHWPQIERFFRF
jgi:predicted alpha/beta-fold hydrolase